MSKFLQGVVSLLVLAAALSCSSAPTEVANREPVTLVVVDPETATLQVGKAVSITAFALDTAGRPQQGRQMFWASSDTRIATVTTQGVVRGIAPGQADIAASAEGKSAIARVTVIPRAVDRVAIQPETAELVVGRTLDLRATAYDDDGGTLSGRDVAWSSGSETIATVSSTGRVTGRVPGTVTITARIEGRSATARITVRPVPVHRVAVSAPATQLRVGETLQLSAMTFDENNNQLTGRVVTWSSSNANIATVNGSGLVTGRAAGDVTITASSEGRSGSIALTVTAVAAPPPQPPAVASVTVDPSSATLDVGGTVDLQATVRAGDGTILTDRPVNWSSSNTLVASVSSTGRVTALSPGSATITATSEGVSGSATITVRSPSVPGQVVRVEVTPSSATLSARNNETIQLQARAYDAQGREVTGLAVLWTSSNSAIATVSSTGLVRAISPGGATITARISGVSGTAEISVNFSR